MSNPIRVLQVFTIMDMGGAETMIMNYYRNIDRSKVQFDFLVHREEKGYYEDEIKSLGGRIFRVPALYDVFAHIKGIRKFLKEHKEYKIIHGHVSILGYFLYKEAKKLGFPIIIAHAHNNSCDISWRWPLWMTLRYMIRPHYTHAMTCGIDSATWTFGKQKGAHAIQLNNAIDSKRFTFDLGKREKVRNQMGWNNHYVICNVARFFPQKNHKFLLFVFNATLRIRPESILALVGAKNGLYEEIKHAAEDMGIADKIQFLGARTDVCDILQGADVFCLPSKYEGFGIVMLEAQAAGLRTVKSDGVENDGVLIPDLVETCSLQDSDTTWAQSLCKPYQRKNTYEEICAAGFDILTNAAWLQDFYLSHHRSR